MESMEIVRRAIKFNNPPRLPFFLGGVYERIRKAVPDIPNDLCDCAEMDRQKAGWFFDNAAPDDWGCGWGATEQENMGQVVYHPLADWSKLDTYLPPDPKDSFYYDRIGDAIADAGSRYVMVRCHFNLIERLHMLHGFEQTMMDLYTCPEKCEKVLDMIVEFKLQMFDELHRRYGDRVHGLWLTDDWGTQTNTYISTELFRQMFLRRYKALADKIHSCGWLFHLHSCGKVNDFVPLFIEAGVDVANMQQPQAYGIKEIGNRFAGKMCFETTADIQATLPTNDTVAVKKESKELVENWSTPQGGLIVCNYGMASAIGVSDQIEKVMFQSFYELRNFWDMTAGQR